MRNIIFTEGNNTKFLRKALIFENLESEVNIIDGFESITGKYQLKTLFDFFIRAPHKSIVLFVWDCDANDVVNKLQDGNHTYPFIFAKNPDNKYSTKGIENLFPCYLLNVD